MQDYYPDEQDNEEQLEQERQQFYQEWLEDKAKEARVNYDLPCDCKRTLDGLWKEGLNEL